MRKPANSGSIKIWRSAELNAELHVGTAYRHPYPRHWHENFYVAAITGGAGYFEFRNSTHVAIPGTLMVIAPGDIHAHHEAECGRDFRSLHPSASSSLAPELVDIGSRPIVDSNLFRKFLCLHKALELGGNQLERDSLTCSFFQKLKQYTNGQSSENSPHKAAPGGECKAVSRARELLHEHYDREIPLQELAAAVDLSPYHFNRVFCRQTGMPPHAYQMHLRIMRARELVRERLPLAHIAALTGFFDQSHFTHQFKRLVGITPSQYAQL